MSRNREYPPDIPWGYEPPGTVIYSLPGNRYQVARRRRGVPLLVWPGIPVALAGLIIASGSVHLKPSGTPAPAHPVPAPVRTVVHTRTITHTVTHVVRAHPLMTGGQVLIALAIIAFVVLGVTAIRVTHRGSA